MADERLKPKYPGEQLVLALLGFLCSLLVAAIKPNMSSIIPYLDNVAQLFHNLLGILKAPEINGATKTLDAADFHALFVSLH